MSWCKSNVAGGQNWSVPPLVSLLVSQFKLGEVELLDLQYLSSPPAMIVILLVKRNQKYVIRTRLGWHVTVVKPGSVPRFQPLFDLFWDPLPALTVPVQP